MTIHSWTLTQLLKLNQSQPDLVNEALETALAQSSKLQRAIIVGAYLDGEINLGKAAELLGVHRLELQAQFLAQGIPIRVGAMDIPEANAEVQAIHTWNQNAQGE